MLTLLSWDTFIVFLIAFHMEMYTAFGNISVYALCVNIIFI